MGWNGALLPPNKSEDGASYQLSSNTVGTWAYSRRIDQAALTASGLTDFSLR